MPKNFCYCIGGTGARVAEVAAHVCAMNLAGEDDIEFIIVDKDFECGGTAQAKRVVESVGALSDPTSSDGLMCDTTPKAFCKSKLFVNQWNFNDALGAIVGVNKQASLSETVCDCNWEKMADDRVLFDALYSKDDQQADTSRGFYGHPAIGDLLFKHMVKITIYNNTLVEPIQQYYYNGGDYARVFIIGSAFGGTGASVFSNLAAYIRSALSDFTDKVFISGCLLLPYFTVPPAGFGARIRTEEFMAKAMATLKRNSKNDNLIRDEYNRDGCFDSLYVCGQDPGNSITSGYSEGGPAQVNHMDIVDFAAALAMGEFFRKEWIDKGNPVTDGNIYEYCFDAGAGAAAGVITMDANMNNTAFEPRKNVVAMLSFCTFILTHPIADMLLQPDDIGNNGTVTTLFGNHNLFQRRAFEQEYNNNHRQPLINICNRMFDYCKSFVRFAYDIAYTGRDWTGTGNDHSIEYDLISKYYIDMIDRLILIMEQYKENPTAVHAKEVQTAVRRMSDANVIISGVPCGATSQQTEAEMHRIFSARVDRYNSYQVDAGKRIGDYLHEAYAYCYSQA